MSLRLLAVIVERFLLVSYWSFFVCERGAIGLFSYCARIPLA